jgi:hypothetical protein
LLQELPMHAAVAMQMKIIQTEGGTFPFFRSAFQQRKG